MVDLHQISEKAQDVATIVTSIATVASVVAAAVKAVFKKYPLLFSHEL